MIDLYGYSLPTIFVGGLVAILAVGELGWQLGTRSGGRGGGNFLTLESAVLGLMALIIGFSFAMALSRYGARRDAILKRGQWAASMAASSD